MIKVLFVDDYLEHIQGDIDQLDDEIFIKITARNGNEALQKIKSEKEAEFTVIVSDIRMPGLNGIELTREIFRYNRFLPVILLTQYGPEYMKEAIEAGAFWYLVKNNYHFEELMALINRAHLFYTYQRLKDNFVHSISHITRTPLFQIKSIGETIDLNNPEDLEMLKDITKSVCETMQKTLTNLFDYSDIKSGNYEMKKTKMDLDKTIRNIMNQFNDAVNQKEITMYYNSGASNYMLFVDEYSINRIFFELIDNAVKYTNRGEIVVSVHTGINSLVVDIADSGIGISPYAQENIFEEFYKAEIGPIQNNLGYGLGLTVASEFAKLNGARILCMSTLGKGSKFSVIFD